MEEMEIEIDVNGKVTMRTHGVKGHACMDYADLLATIVGKEQSREKTAELYESPVEVRRNLDVKQRRC